jgi:hypothetical protein
MAGAGWACVFASSIVVVVFSPGVSDLACLCVYLTTDWLLLLHYSARLLHSSFCTTTALLLHDYGTTTTPTALLLLHYNYCTATTAQVFLRAIHNSQWLSEMEFELLTAYFSPLCRKFPQIVPNGE